MPSEPRHGRLIAVMFYSLTCLALSRFTLFGIGGLSRHFLGHTVSWADIWLHWDSGWYLTVIREGYTEPFWTGMLYGQANYAFFPLYPYTVRLFANVIPAEIAGTVV